MTLWYLIRSSGVVAYLLLTGSMLWGLLLSTRLVKAMVPPALALALHRSLSWLSVGVAGFHAFALLFDHYYQYTLLDLLFGFAGPYRPFWVGLGSLAFYAAFLISLSFSLRGWIGAKLWRRLHYLTFPLYGMVTLHGIMAGSDSANPGMQGLYLGSVGLVLFLTLFRILSLAIPSPALRARGR